MDENLNAVAPPAGQPVTPPETDQTGATSPGSLSRDEVLTLLKETEDKAFRRAQGLITKTNTRIREEVTKLEQQLTKAGVALDATQRAKLEQEVTERVITEGATEPEGVGQPPALSQAQNIDPITQAANEYMQEVGVMLYDDDPEAKELDTSTPRKFLKSLEEACEKKKARVTASTKTAGKVTSTPGIVSGGNAPSPYQGKSGLRLIQDYFETKS